MGERDSGTLKVLPFLTRSCDGVRGLTARPREIMELVVAGHPSKNIAADLRISHCREPSGLNHEKNRLDIYTGVSMPLDGRSRG